MIQNILKMNLEYDTMNHCLEYKHIIKLFPIIKKSTWNFFLLTLQSNLNILNYFAASKGDGSKIKIIKTRCKVNTFIAPLMI